MKFDPTILNDSDNKLYSGDHTKNIYADIHLSITKLNEWRTAKANRRTVIYLLYHVHHLINQIDVVETSHKRSHIILTKH